MRTEEEVPEPVVDLRNEIWDIAGGYLAVREWVDDLEGRLSVLVREVRGNRRFDGTEASEISRALAATEKASRHLREATICRIIESIEGEEENVESVVAEPSLGLVGPGEGPGALSG